MALSFAAETDNEVRPLLMEINKKVESGYTFHNALKSASPSFDPVYLGMIQAGELSGRLHEMLERMADVLERECELRKRLVSVVTYPIVLLVICLLGTLGFMFFILPTLTPLFLDLGVDLPLPTRILLLSKEFLVPVLIVVPLMLVLLYLARHKIREFIHSKPALARGIDSFLFNIPVLGEVYDKMVTSRVLYSLYPMLEVGMTVNQALTLSQSAAGNALTAFRLGRARSGLADGLGVTECFRDNNLFSESALHLIHAGEEAAKLADMFQYVAKLCDEEVEYSLEAASGLLEPIIMIVMGVLVGFVTISAALPTIHLLQNFS